MKAIVKSRPEAGLWMEDVPVPQPGPNDVLVRIHKTAICGTDLHIFNWDEWSRKHVTTPVVIGHEFAGTVEAVGDGVRGFKKGDVVSGEGHIVCGVCRNCMAGRRHLCRDTAGVGVSRAGAFAEFLCIPAANVWYAGDSASSGRKQRATEVTENGDGPERPNLCSPSSVTSVAGLSAVPMDVLAYFDPLGNATHAALSFDLVGEDVLITGAGPIGIMAAAVAKHVGARYVVVTDVNPYRLVLARRIGADLALDVRTQKIEDAQDALNMREGFDVGLEMSGSPEAFRSMLSNMRHGAGISLLGILPPDTSINWDRVIFNSLILKGIYGREMFETWYKMTSMIQSGLDVSTVLTHRFPAERFREAFEVVRSGDCGKVILEWA